MSMDDGSVRIVLSRAEAIVLFEWLARTQDVLPAMHAAEGRVLARLEGGIERVLNETFLPNYLEIVARAREEVINAPIRGYE